MKILNSLFRRVLLRLRRQTKYFALLIRQLFARRDVIWIEYGWMTLPFHAGGDRQELDYHLDGPQWWRTEQDRLRSYIKPGDVVIDVGANLGFLSALFSKLVGNTGLVHSFEPSPVVFQSLQEVIAVNRLTNVVAHNLACGDVQTVLTLYTPASSGNSSFCPPEQLGIRTRSVTKVPVVPLDSYILGMLDRLAFLKIDTEGFEDKVLRGASKLIERFRPIVYIELTNEYLAASREALSYLSERNYIFPRQPVLERCHNGETFLALPQ